MERIATIDCKGADGVVRKYTCIHESEEYFHVFKVIPKDEPCDDEFELWLKPVESGVLWVKGMKHGRTSRFYGRGVPEATLLHVAQLLDAKIRSTQKITIEGNFRSDEAEKVWKRLVAVGKAHYVENLDVYETF